MSVGKASIARAVNAEKASKTETKTEVKEAEVKAAEKPSEVKAETAEKYGNDQVKLWRRSYDVMPPALEPTDARCPHNQPAYKNVDKSVLPYTESLKETVARVVPYFEEQIKPQLLQGKKVLVTAHGNSLRALVKYLENMTNEEIVELNIPTGVPLAYTFDENFNIVEKKYLGDQEAIKNKMQSVANQGKAKK